MKNKPNPKTTTQDTAGRRKIDWLEIMSVYLADHSIDHNELARRFGVAIVSVKRHAADEKWTERRERIKRESNDALEKKLIAERLLNVDEYNLGDIKLANALRSEIARELNKLKAEGKLDSKRILDLTSAQKNNQHSARLALGLTTNSNELSGKGGAPLNLTPTVIHVEFVNANETDEGSGGN